MSDRLQPPTPPVKVAVVGVAAGCVWHRIHSACFEPTAYNPGMAGNARFSPIVDAAGHPIPTLYVGTTFDCAAMESAFHDVPYGPGPKVVDLFTLDPLVASEIQVMEPLQLADLGSVALRKLGVERKHLIDSDAIDYPITRQWAAQIHADNPSIQGLRWTSRQDDSAMAMMLFGDRIHHQALAVIAPPRPLTGSADALDQLTLLAERIGVRLI